MPDGDRIGNPITAALRKGYIVTGGEVTRPLDTLANANGPTGCHVKVDSWIPNGSER